MAFRVVVNAMATLLSLTVAFGCASGREPLVTEPKPGHPARPQLSEDADALRVLDDTWHHVRHGAALADAGETDAAWAWLRALVAEIDRYLERRRSQSYSHDPVPLASGEYERGNMLERRQAVIDGARKPTPTPQDPDVQAVEDRAAEAFAREGIEP